MKSLCFAALILIAAAPPAWSQDRAAPQELLDAAHNPSGLFQNAAQPFDLEIDFTAQSPSQNPGASPTPMPGHLSIKWQSKDHWWSSVATGGFEQTTIRNGEMESTLRNFPATPGIVNQLFRLLRFNGFSMKYSTTGQRERTEDGVAETCITIRQEEFKANQRELCYDATSHELRTANWETENDGRYREQFSGYQSLGPVRYPQKFVFTKHGDEVLSATVTSLANAPFDAALLVPPEHAITRRKCPDIKGPISVKRVDPTLPRLSGGPGSMEEARASLTVLADGSVGDVAILHASSAAMAQAASQAFKQYKFKPALCGTDPVIADVEIEITARRN